MSGEVAKGARLSQCSTIQEIIIVVTQFIWMLMLATFTLFLKKSSGLMGQSIKTILERVSKYMHRGWSCRNTLWMSTGTINWRRRFCLMLLNRQYVMRSTLKRDNLWEIFDTFLIRCFFIICYFNLIYYEIFPFNYF